jgi:hypothetical protein
LLRHSSASPSQVRLWRNSKHAEFQADVVRQKTRQDEAGLTAARLAEREADDAEAAAVEALYTVPATTITGALALIRYLLVYDRKYFDSDIGEAAPGYRIAVAVERSLSGLLA